MGGIEELQGGRDCPDVLDNAGGKWLTGTEVFVHKCDFAIAAGKCHLEPLAGARDNCQHIFAGQCRRRAQHNALVAAARRRTCAHGKAVGIYRERTAQKAVAQYFHLPYIQRRRYRELDQAADIVEYKTAFLAAGSNHYGIRRAARLLMRKSQCNRSAADRGAGIIWIECSREH